MSLCCTLGTTFNSVSFSEEFFYASFFTLMKKTSTYHLCKLWLINNNHRIYETIWNNHNDHKQPRQYETTTWLKDDVTFTTHVPVECKSLYNQLVMPMYSCTSRLTVFNFSLSISSCLKRFFSSFHWIFLCNKIGQQQHCDTLLNFALCLDHLHKRFP